MRDNNETLLVMFSYRGFGFVTFVDPAIVDKVVSSSHELDNKKVSFTFRESLAQVIIKILAKQFKDLEAVCGFCLSII